MRVGTIFGKHVVMSNEAWKRSLRRVDATRAEKFYYNTKYKIPISCPFCDADKRACAKCPLFVFSSVSSADYGCLRLFKFVRREVGAKDCVHLYDEYISWYKEEDRDARKVLNFIHGQLLKMRKRRRL